MQIDIVLSTVNRTFQAKMKTPAAILYIRVCRSFQTEIFYISDNVTNILKMVGEHLLFVPCFTNVLKLHSVFTSLLGRVRISGYSYGYG